MPCRFSFRFLLAGVAAALAVSCTSTPPATTSASIGGFVFKAPVRGSTVTAFKANAQLERGDVLGTATTGEDGSFLIPMPAYAGPVVVAAAGGTYLEEAVGLGVPLAGELATLVPAYVAGSRLEGVRLQPVSTWALAATVFHVKHGTPLAEAWPMAYAHLSAHFGGGPWDSVTPADALHSATLAPEGRAALALGALSQEAVTMATASKLMPVSLNAGTLTQALADDILADGTWDGVGTKGPLLQGTQGLTGQTMRSALSQALLDFVASPRNGTGLSSVDVRGLAADLVAASDPYLFCPHQAAAECSTAAAADTTAPSLAFTTPADGAVARGSIAIAVSAADVTEVAALSFLAPAALVPTVAVIAQDKKSATLSATLDVSALPDGDVLLQARAVDASQNAATAGITIHVRNKGPTIVVSAPAAAGVVHGSVAVTATATPNGSPVSSLEVVDAPAGMGADTDVAADSLAAQWDTTQALEGPALLRFRARDSNGGLSEATVAVTVDNRPLGVITAAVWAGQPVAGAQVRLLAIDPLTGAPATGRDAGPVLGEALLPTDSDGGVTFALSQENYAGPVQLEATGVGLSVADPSSATPAPIALPPGFKLTSYVPAYRTGDVLAVHASLWTTIADSAARSLVTPSADGGVQALPAAMAATDALMAGHVARPATWSLRTTPPVLLTSSPQTLGGPLYASLADVALHRLARDISASSHILPGGAVTAFTLAQQLSQDVADGLFDGKAGGLQLSVVGAPSYDLDANTSRYLLALALDGFVRGPTNRTGLTRATLQAAGIFDDIASDAPPINSLYPAAPAPVAFDSTPPTTTLSVVFTNATRQASAPVGAAQLVGGVLLVTVDATDLSELQSLELRSPAFLQAGGSIHLEAGTTASHISATLDTKLVADGAYTLTAHACDKAGNCGDIALALTVDNTVPGAAFAAPLPGAYNASITVDVVLTDANGVATAVVTPASLPGFVDTNAAAERIQGTWAFPSTLVDGPLTVTVQVCDVVGNCTQKSSVGVIVDRTPPTVTTVLAYSLQGGPSTPAVGSPLTLGGTLTQTTDATDANGVASLVVTCAGATLVPQAAGNTLSHVLSRLDTTTLQDGARSITAHACDVAGNCTDASVAFVVDNTAPAIALAAPVAGFYSAGITLDATATDASGVASLGTSALQGFVDTDASAARLAGSWLFPVGLADGPLSLPVQACDVVGNCSTAAASGVSVDRSAPQLAWLTSPPIATATTGSLNVALSATDGAGAGVQQVWVRAPALSVALAASWNGTAWVAAIPMAAAAQGASITIEAWAVDGATTANSGLLAPVGATHLSTSTLVDRLGPVVAAGGGVALPSYTPEALWSLQVDAFNHPLVPVQYNTNGAVAQAVSPGSTVSKLGSNVHAADGNTPILTYQVTTTAKAPVAAVELLFTVPFYAADANGTVCVKPSGCPFVHPLTLSTRTAAGFQYWDLPVTWEMLDGRAGAMTLTVRFTDITGTQVTRNDALTLSLVPPLLGVSEDASWTSAGDPKSIYAYRRTSGTYGALFTASTARLVRYVYENPTPWPIAVQLPAVAGQVVSLNETWGNYLVNRDKLEPGGLTDVGINLPAHNYLEWATTSACDARYWFPDNCNLDDIGSPMQGSPSPANTFCSASGGVCFHSMASASAPTFRCLPPNQYASAFNLPSETMNVIAAGTAMSTSYFSDVKAAGNETVPALAWTSAVSGATMGAIVPAASGGVAGRVVAYFLAPLPAFSRAQLALDPLTYVVLPEMGPTAVYQWKKGYLYSLLGAHTPCSFTGFSTAFELNAWYRGLNSASWTIQAPAARITTGAPVALAAGAVPAVEGQNLQQKALGSLNRTWAP